MSVAWEIIKKLPKIVWFGSEAFFGEFFDDFSAYRHARAKISTVLESARSAGSIDTHKPYIFDKKNLTLKVFCKNFTASEEPSNRIELYI